MEGNSAGGGGGGGSGGGNDVELLCKTLQVEHKLFYFDLKENPRGRYLKISEKTSAARSTIIVPSDGISWFLDLFNYYVNTDKQDVFSKELQLDSKVFYFDVGENRRGRFLKSTKPQNKEKANSLSRSKKLHIPATLHHNRPAQPGLDHFAPLHHTQSRKPSSPPNVRDLVTLCCRKFHIVRRLKVSLDKL